MADPGRVFLSHAGSDSEVARRVAALLEASQLVPVLDRNELDAGDSFLDFMEQALSTSDYCLLLWSAAAASRKWVREEWQAALHRSVEEARSFLLVGRLDGHPLPALLAPRLYVELHPQVEPGVAQLVETWQRDRIAEQSSGRPVASAPGLPPDDARPSLYVTSDLFGITCPWRVDLGAPAGVLVDEVRQRMKLPEALDHQGRVGVRFHYHLAREETRLDRSKALAAQGVTAGSVVWLECEMVPFAAVDAQRGEMGRVVFRGLGDPDPTEEARRVLLARINDAGLGGERRGSR
jgi:hypothetical protein